MSSVKTRRSFLKSSMLFGSGTALVATTLPESRAGEARTDSGKYPNETLRIIQNLRTIHGNFTNWLGRNASPTSSETQMFQLLKRSGFVDLQKA